MMMIRHLNPQSENILPSQDAQLLELHSVHEATHFRKKRDTKHKGERVDDENM